MIGLFKPFKKKNRVNFSREKKSFYILNFNSVDIKDTNFRSFCPSQPQNFFLLTKMLCTVSLSYNHSKSLVCSKAGLFGQNIEHHIIC